MNILPINLETLIYQRNIESVRIEFKKSFSEQTLEQITRTICAFANDFLNLNGGYILIGLDEQDGKAKLPPAGLQEANIDNIQKRIRTQCKRIVPEYQPILSPEIFQDKLILVIWAPAGDVRPYQAPESLNSGERYFYIRLGSETVKAMGQNLAELMQMTAKVPFDDRRNLSTSFESISPTLVRNYLANIKSDLISPFLNLDDKYIFERLRLTVKINSHEIPRNVSLLFFTNEPDQYFPGARIDVIQFKGGAAGDLIDEKIFKGPIDQQIKQTLNFLNSLSTTVIEKQSDQAEAERFISFPFKAMREALVNAVYHKSYEINEPVKVFLYPDRMEIISYPGPVPGIKIEQFQPLKTLPAVPHRNRRIGEFLKTLDLAEGFGTGIPKIFQSMEENGSPVPVFEFDEDRSYFRTILPAHPYFVERNAMDESHYLWHTGEKIKAIQLLEDTFKKVPVSTMLITQIYKYYDLIGKKGATWDFVKNFAVTLESSQQQVPIISFANVLYHSGNIEEATEILTNAPVHIELVSILENIPESNNKMTRLELAWSYRRKNKFSEAHQILQESFELIRNSPQQLYSFALIKIRLAITLRTDNYLAKRLNIEALELFQRILQLRPDPNLKAWVWFNTARSYQWLGRPNAEIVEAYENAIKLLPEEKRFKDWHNRFLKK